MSIQDFLGYIRQQGMQLSKPHLYDVDMTIPGMGVNKSIRFLCHQAQIPGIDIQTNANKMYGLQYEIPYEISQAPVSLTMYVDKKLDIVNYFNRVRNLMFDANTNVGGLANLPSFSPKYKQDYQFVTSITVYDANNKDEVMIYTLNSCFIKSISSLELNHESQNEIQRLTLTIVYETMAYEVKKANVLVGTCKPPNIENTPAPVNVETVEAVQPELLSTYKQSNDPTPAEMN